MQILNWTQVEIFFFLHRCTLAFAFCRVMWINWNLSFWLQEGFGQWRKITRPAGDLLNSMDIFLFTLRLQTSLCRRWRPSNSRRPCMLFQERKNSCKSRCHRHAPAYPIIYCFNANIKYLSDRNSTFPPLLFCHAIILHFGFCVIPV